MINDCVEKKNVLWLLREENVFNLWLKVCGLCKLKTFQWIQKISGKKIFFKMKIKLNFILCELVLILNLTHGKYQIEKEKRGKFIS